jgi:hypothetical protein
MQSDVPMLLAPLTQSDESLLSSVRAGHLTITSLNFIRHICIAFMLSIYVCMTVALPSGHTTCYHTLWGFCVGGFVCLPS